MYAKLIIAAHKPYEMPASRLYLPVQVGSLGRPDIGLARDDSGEHISQLNPWFCELTALYWVWKNLLPGWKEICGTGAGRIDGLESPPGSESDGDALPAGTHAPERIGPGEGLYLGLVHYRRYFSGNKPGRPKERPLERALDGPGLLRLARQGAVILPRRRRYYIETLKSHFRHAHGGGELELLREVIRQGQPEYLPSFDLVMNRTWLHLFNMFIMRQEYFEPYCAWLFSVLFGVADQLRERKLEPAPRIYGFMAERLLDVWLEKNKVRALECDYLLLEKIDWPKKIAAFLQRKFFRPGITPL